MEEGLKIAFWNVAGLRSKDEDFWKKVEAWDVVGLTETWVEEKGWEKMSGSLPNGYIWDCQVAKRERKKGRAIGGIVMGIRRGIQIMTEEKEEKGREGVMMKRIKWGENTWKIVTVYLNGDIRKTMGEIRVMAGEKGLGKRVIIGGDFNARTGEKGAMVGCGGEEWERRSKDKKINKEGRILLEEIEEEGWGIMNGAKEGDKEGEFTYVGARGTTVIDYVIGDAEAWEETEKFVVEEGVESDHQPIVVELKGGRKNLGEEKRRQWKEIMDWSLKGIEEFRERIKVWEKEGVGGEGEEEGERGVEEKEKRILEAISKRRVKVRRVGTENRWWDQACREKKGEVRIAMRNWRMGRKGKEEYVEKKKEYNRLCEEKKEREREKYIKEVKEAKTESQVWEIINRERKGKGRVDERIEMKEWKEYFVNMLGGVEERERTEVKVRKRWEEGGVEELTREEVRRMIKKLKKKKAAGIDGIPNEAWMYGGEKLEKTVWEMCNRAWKGEEIPASWREGVIVPIRKKGKGSKVEDYRGITLMSTAYKIYAMILAEKLEREVEGKGMIPRNQTGFRKKVGTVDNIYVLNYLIGREVRKEKGKMIGVFVDFRAAFDSVDRKELWKALEEREVSRWLRERIEEVYQETGCRIRVGERWTEKWWTVKGIRQGCPLSPMLFNLFIADMEGELAKRRRGGIKLNGERIWTLAFADDVVVLAENEEDMKVTLKELEKYVGKKKLEVNVGKTKVMRFRKGGGRWKSVDWGWKNEKLEEVKEFKYLGYVVKRNGGQEAHVRERVKKAREAMRQVWGIGKRRFSEDWGRRMKLFDCLVSSVVLYGAEVWGWREREGVERLQEQYIRWTLGVDARTPGYMLREETKRDKMRTRAGKRGMKFEEKLERGEGGELARMCWEEMKGKNRGEESEWEKERRKYCEERGYSVEELKRRREKGRSMVGELEERDKELQGQENGKKIRESSYNNWYREIVTVGKPRYLRGRRKEEKRRRIARFRLGNEMRAGRYWEQAEERKCRICGWEEETWEHVLERCEEGRGVNIGERIREILDDGGGGEEWMEELERKRSKGTRSSGQDNVGELRDGGGRCE